jgi:hypothetical protein
VIESIDEFFDQKKPDDLLVLYFSGHGVRDELGALYLAARNTIRTRLRSTAVKSDYIRDAMNQSRSKRQVVILDCCNSGAFLAGMKAEVGGAMGMVSAFQGYGRYVLTASDEIQFAWEGDKIIGETNNSLFTHFLLKGLEGEADSDSDGRITVDELYDYTYEQISRVTPKQTPRKDASKQEGEIVLRQITRIEDIKPIALADDLLSEIEDLRPYVREAAVQKLEKIIKGKNIGLARSAREALEKIVVDDNTTRRVAQMATQVLESVRQAEQKAEEERRAREETERLAALKAEEERLVREKEEAERKAKEESEKLLQAQAEREAAEREAARLKAEREAAELAARQASERAEKEKAEKEAAEQEAVQKAEREAMELASRRKAEREAAERAEREAIELAARRKAEREEKEKETAGQKAEKKAVLEALEFTPREKAKQETAAKATIKESKTTKRSLLTVGIIGTVTFVLVLCGYGMTRLLSSLPGSRTEATATKEENVIFTEAALTVQAQLTHAAPFSTSTLPPTLTTSVPSSFNNFSNFHVINDAPGELQFTVDYNYNGENGNILFSAGCLYQGQRQDCVDQESSNFAPHPGPSNGTLVFRLGLYGPNSATTDQIFVGMYVWGPSTNVAYQVFDYEKEWTIVLPTPTMVR